MKKIELKKGKALVIVAHPDDETIWMGGTILNFPNVQWTIFSLCREDDKDRAQKFKKACSFYGARAIISNLEDEGVMTIQKSIREIERRISRKIREKKFTFLFSHGPNGEYGHPRHIGVHRAIKQMIKKRELVVSKHFYFAYRLDKGRGICVSCPRAEFYLKLSKEEFKTKRDILKNIYGFSKFSFENRSCTKVETFDKYYL